MENRNNSRRIVEAGLFAALTVIMAFFVFFVPLIGMIGVAALPIPFAILYIRHDFKVALTSLIASIVLISITMGIQRGISLGSMYGPTGLILGYCFKYKIKMSRSIFLLAVVSIIGYALNFSFYLLFIDKNFFIDTINMTIKSFRDSMERSLQMAGTTTGSPQYDQLKQQLDIITPEFLLYLLPAFLVVYGFVVGFINFIVTRSILKKLRYEVIEVSAYDRVYIDNRLGALLIIVTCVGIILDRRNLVIGKYILTSGAIVMQFALLIVGSAVVNYYAKHKFNMNKTSAIVITVALVLPPMNTFVIYIGLADLILDFRKVDPNRLFKGRNANK